MAPFSGSVSSLIARVLLLVALAAVVSTAIEAKFSWRVSSDAVWAHGCDFSSKNDIGWVTTSGAKCSSTCGLVRGCTHFVWSTFSGLPRCHLKRGRVTLSDAYSTTVKDAVCGIMRK